MWSLTIALSLGFAGCNLFHPTGSRDADNDDAAALTHDGYLEYQKANYDAARNFFSKAIKADSSHSEAWVGLAKSVLHSQKGINVFELVSYAQTPRLGYSVCGSTCSLPRVSVCLCDFPFS